AAVPAVAVRAVRTDPAAAARGVRPAAARRPAPRIRTLPDPKVPRRILRTRREPATHRQRTPAGAGAIVDAAAVPPAVHRIPAPRVHSNHCCYSQSAATASPLLQRFGNAVDGG